MKYIVEWGTVKRKHGSVHPLNQGQACRLAACLYHTNFELAKKYQSSHGNFLTNKGWKQALWRKDSIRVSIRDEENFLAVSRLCHLNGDAASLLWRGKPIDPRDMWPGWRHFEPVADDSGFHLKLQLPSIWCGV